MNLELESWMFTVPLALKAHARARQSCRHQSDPQKAKQIYLNTLSVYAVDVYLQTRGLRTDGDNGNSWDGIMSVLMDTASLVVQNCGQLECRPVLTSRATIQIPPEVWKNRIGYVAVQLHESLREATLLGFIDKVTSSELPLSQLRPLEELPGYLNTIGKLALTH